MRFLLPAALIVLAATTPPPVARDWRTVATRTADGAHLIGNPAARVKLVEYASYTCSHCADFSGQSAAVLEGQMIRSGTTSLEFRHLIRDRFDLASAVLARCAGPARFLGTSKAIFAAQATWLPRAIAWEEANAARIAALPLPRRLRASADGAGLSAIARARGLTPAAMTRCFADKAEVDRIAAMATAPAEVLGTPTFFVNGRLQPPGGWDRIEPVLRAEGAR